MDILTFLRLCLIFLGVYIAIRISASEWGRDRDKTNVVGLLLALLGTTTKAEHQVEGGLLLDVVIIEGATVLELLAGKDQTLLVGGNPSRPLR